MRVLNSLNWIMINKVESQVPIFFLSSGDETWFGGDIINVRVALSSLVLPYQGVSSMTLQFIAGMDSINSVCSRCCYAVKL